MDRQSTTAHETDDFAALLEALSTKPAPHGHDLQRLRQALYRRGRLDRQHAAWIVHANRIMQTSDDGWIEFYLEALIGFFLDHRGDDGTLSPDREALLLAWLGEGEGIDHVAERRLALRILLQTRDTPERLERRVLAAIFENFLHQSERWLGPGRRRPGIIDALDIQLIRRLLHGNGGLHPRLRHRAAVTFMLDLDREASRFVDPEGWRDLLVGYVLRYLWGALFDARCQVRPTLPDLDAALEDLLDPLADTDAGHHLRSDVLKAARPLIAPGPKMASGAGHMTPAFSV